LLTAYWGAFIIRRTPATIVDFDTYHRVCTRCRWEVRAFGLVTVSWIVLSIIVMIPALFFCMWGRIVKFDWSGRGGTVYEYPYRFYGLLALAAAVAVIVLVTISRKRRIFFRKVGGPFNLRWVRRCD
jgi:hypothetical protein